MAYNVKFLKGTAAQYSALASKDANTFYFTSDDSKLYLGTIELSTPEGVAAAIALVNNATKGNEALYSAIQTLNGDVTTDGSVAKAIDTKAKAILGNDADLTKLTTTAKTIIAAINELDAEISDLTSDSKVSLETAETATAGYLKTYELYQGKDKNKTLVGRIDIPKDLVVTSGEIVNDPEGQPAGKYIKLTIANQEAPVYINVKDLVDVYTEEKNATQVQIAISDANVVSATIVAKSIGTTELTDSAVTTAKINDSAVTTAKIADENVTKEKLASGVQTSLDKADSALQESDITETTSEDDKGKIAVGTKKVAVNGLGTAAFTNASAYDAAGSAATAQSNAEAYTDTALTWGTLA